MVAQREAVDKALASFRRDVRGLEVDESRFYDKLAVVLPELSKLNAGRRENVDDPAATASATLKYYSGIIERLLAVNDEIAGDTDNQTLIGHVAAFASLAQLKEFTSLERGVSIAAAAPEGSVRVGSRRWRGSPERGKRGATSSTPPRALSSAPRWTGRCGAAWPVRGPCRSIRCWSRVPRRRSSSTRPSDLATPSARVGLLRQVEEQVAADLAASGRTLSSWPTAKPCSTHSS